jgi:DNA-directed RNA polymerase specialized sigma54-like protein
LAPHKGGVGHVHESTVSRAVVGKYMLLPSRAVLPVQDFFHAALAQ